MNRFHKTDLTINVLLPILVGMIIYFLSNYFEINTFARNHLPDALWAWSLFSCILIIWERSVSTFWIAVVFAFCILFEVMQHYQFINGVGDYLDVLFYLLAGTLALLFNQYFFILFKYNYDKTYQN